MRTCDVSPASERPFSPWLRRVALVFVGTIAALLAPSRASAGGVDEFPIPALESNSTLIVTGPDGNLWFTEGTAGRIGRITPEGAVTEFDTTTTDVGHGPFGIAVGSDGNIWFTTSERIGRITTAGLIDSFPLPWPTSYPAGIAAGPDGNLWFTVFSRNKIGRITTAGVVTEFDLTDPHAFPYFIAAGPDGNLWFTEGSGNRIGRITTEGTITEFPLPNLASHPAQITEGPDGNLWFTEQGGDRIGRITTEGTITEFPLPAPGNEVFGIAPGADGALWFTEWDGNRIGRITVSGEITEYPLPNPGSGPAGITAGPDGKVWFIEAAGNRIGRMGLPVPGYYPITPCRLFDTRRATGPDAASPALDTAESRVMALAGRCAIPVTARALSVNVTVTEAQERGDLVLFRGDLASRPTASTLAFSARRVCSNNGVLALDLRGDRTIRAYNGSGGTAQLILDVSGYFE